MARKRGKAEAFLKRETRIWGSGAEKIEAAADSASRSTRLMGLEPGGGGGGSLLGDGAATERRVVEFRKRRESAPEDAIGD